MAKECSSGNGCLDLYSLTLTATYSSQPVSADTKYRDVYSNISLLGNILLKIFHIIVLNPQIGMFIWSFTRLNRYSLFIVNWISCGIGKYLPTLYSSVGISLSHLRVYFLDTYFPYYVIIFFFRSNNITIKSKLKTGERERERERERESEIGEHSG